MSNDKMVLGIGRYIIFRYFWLTRNRVITFVKLAAYARAYILQDSKQNNINSPTAENGFSGGFTKINGLLSYYEVQGNFNFVSS